MGWSSESHELLIPVDRVAVTMARLWCVMQQQWTLYRLGVWLASHRMMWIQLPNFSSSRIPILTHFTQMILMLVKSTLSVMDTCFIQVFGSTLVRDVGRFFNLCTNPVLKWCERPLESRVKINFYSQVSRVQLNSFYIHMSCGDSHNHQQNTMQNRSLHLVFQ